MAKNPLNNVIFQDASKAREWLESLLWANGRSCGYCGTLEASSPLKGREGYYQCKACRKQFTVTVGTVFERSHIPLNKWLMAAFLMAASKKGISAHQGHRMLGITYKSAWFMWHRLREAMKAGALPPLGGAGMVVEADETYLGNLPPEKAPIRKNPKRPKFGPGHKRAIVTLVERGGNTHRSGVRNEEDLPDRDPCRRRAHSLPRSSLERARALPLFTAGREVRLGSSECTSPF